MAEFAQPTATREALAQQVADLLNQRITAAHAFDLARQVLSKSEIAVGLAGTSDKKSKAYKAALRRVERWVTAAAEKRKPSKTSLAQMAAMLQKNRQALTSQFPRGVRMTLNATITVGGNPQYRRQRTGITVDFAAEEAAALLLHAQEDPDEAWQDFFDAYVMPAGTVDNPQIRLEVR